MNKLKKLIGKTAFMAAVAAVMTATVVMAEDSGSSGSGSRMLCGVSGTAQNARCTNPGAEYCQINGVANAGLCKDTTPAGKGCYCSANSGGN